MANSSATKPGPSAVTEQPVNYDPLVGLWGSAQFPGLWARDKKAGPCIVCDLSILEQKKTLVKNY